MNKIITLIIFLILEIKIIARSIHRTMDPQIGSIVVNFENDPKNYTLYHHYLKEHPLFKTYNEEYLMSKQIPEEISLRYEPNRTVKKSEIETIIKKLMDEINEGKKEFSEFKILKKRDFNFFSKCGLLVLKFKNEKFPFIFKLFIECPKSFVKPDKKSFQVRGVFVLGGTFRHIMGYTRLRNLDLIKEKIKNDPVWSNKVDLPRKWFWVPKENKKIIIKGYNLGGKKEQEIKIPEIYGLLCDEIKEDNKRDSKIKKDYLKFCSFLDYTLDPLPSNFKAGDNGKIILIDTEHFATLIGIEKPFKAYDKYSEYWPKLIGKYFKDRMATSKRDRRKRQQNSEFLFPLY